MTGSEGQDWASYQPDAPTTTGLAFAGVKATEGANYINPRHAAQVAHARAGGLVVIHYHYAKPGPVAAQVAYFLQHAAPQAGDVLALDWEDTGVPATDKDAWIKQAQAAAPGHQVLLYCDLDFWLNRDMSTFCGDGLWIADPSAPKGQPRIKSSWAIHQYSDAGGLDRDYSQLTPAQFNAWARAKEKTPVADPTAQIATDTAALKTDLLKVASLSEKDAKGAPVAHPASYYLAHIHWDALQANIKLDNLAKAQPAAALTDAQATALGAQLAANPDFISALAAAIGADFAARFQS